MSYITIRVVGQDGRPKPQAKVEIDNGSVFNRVAGTGRTDGDGEAEIRWDGGSSISIYVNGRKVRTNEPVNAHFTVVV